MHQTGTWTGCQKRTSEVRIASASNYALRVAVPLAALVCFTPGPHVPGPHGRRSGQSGEKWFRQALAAPTMRFSDSPWRIQCELSSRQETDIHSKGG